MADSENGGNGLESASQEVVKEFGQNENPQTSQSKIHVINVIGQIEGHTILPPQNKTTKYEHILPQLVAIEQNPNVEGLLLLLNTVGGSMVCPSI